MLISTRNIAFYTYVFGEVPLVSATVLVAVFYFRFLGRNPL